MVTKQNTKPITEQYSHDELIEGYKAFGVPKECVVAALKGIKKASKEEAITIIDEFMKREVR